MSRTSTSRFLIVVQGIGLFLFIPLVLVLYLRQPLGAAWSIVVGLVIMFGHRFVAAPWMARHAAERCLWCGCVGRMGHVFPVVAGGEERRVAACSQRHRDAVGRFLTFVSRRRALIAIGIFVPLIVLLVGTLALAAGRPLLAPAWNAWQFRTIIALTVVMTSVAYLRVSRPAEPLRSPFPLHNFFLLGIRNTLWVFRVVGAWWLVAGIVQLLG